MEAISDCLRDGEVCMAQCLRLLGKGNTSMADCSKNVHQMLAVCDDCEAACRAVLS